MTAALLKSIVERQFIVSDRQEVTRLTPELLKNLGAVEWELRDYSYMILSSWIWGWYDHTYYSVAELKQLGNTVKKNILIGLGDSENDSVFLRTYSILVLNDLTNYDRLHPYLEESEIRDRQEIYLNYLAGEQDLRGYVSPQKGWAHGMAHVADSLGILGQNPYLNDGDLLGLLEAITNKLRSPVASVYLHSEEERFAQAAVKICQNNLVTVEQISSWLNAAIEPEQRLPAGRFVWDDFARYPWRKILTESQEKLCAYRNIQNFLRAFYFQWHQLEDATEKKDLVREEINHALQFLDTGFYNTERGFFAADLCQV